jgi:hypothetical protein
LHGGSGGEASAVFAEGSKQTWCQRWSSAGQVGEELVVGKLFDELGDFGVEAVDARRQYAQLRQERVDEQACRGVRPQLNGGTLIWNDLSSPRGGLRSIFRNWSFALLGSRSERVSGRGGRDVDG